MRAFSDETSSLPNDSMRPLFEQIEILSSIQTVYSDCKYILYIYAQPLMMASSRGESPAGAINRIYNKVPDRDWFSARLFVTLSARDHVGVQLQLFDLNFL